MWDAIIALERADDDMPPALQTIFGPPPRGARAKRRIFTPADRRGAVAHVILT